MKEREKHLFSCCLFIKTAPVTLMYAVLLLVFTLSVQLNALNCPVNTWTCDNKIECINATLRCNSNIFKLLNTLKIKSLLCKKKKHTQKNKIVFTQKRTKASVFYVKIVFRYIKKLSKVYFSDL